MIMVTLEEVGLHGIILLDNAPVGWKIVGKIQAKSGKHTGGSFFIQVGNQLDYS